MAPDRLVGAVEMMDLPGASPGELAHTLKDLAWINRWLGGTRLVRRRLACLLNGQSGPMHLLDVATGYADIPRAIVRWGRRRGLSLQIDALDHHQQILALAHRASGHYPEIRLQPGDALALPYPDGSFDCVLACLILHHMEGGDATALLHELYRVARRAVLVSDLRRGRWPFVATWAGLRVLSRSPLIHHDGPLSVRRGFLPEELLALAREAGWARARVTRHTLFRLALVGEKF